MAKTNGSQNRQIEPPFAVERFDSEPPALDPALGGPVRCELELYAPATRNRPARDAVAGVDRRPRAGELPPPPADDGRRGLEESLAQVRRLAAHLQDTREREHRAIAREIQDDLGHQLAALKLDLVSLERHLKRTRSGLVGRAASMKTLVDEAIGSLRRLSWQLRPGILDDFGLVTAIEWQIERFEDQTGIGAELLLQAAEAGISSTLKTAVFRLLEEALTNVSHHSRASHVQILLRREPTELLVEVRDNGAGFEPERLLDPRANGVTGMRERVIALGGVFRIDGVAGCGTTVSARLPLDDAGSADPLRPIPTARVPGSPS
jgi:signal transduction histidine kinase